MTTTVGTTNIVAAYLGTTALSAIYVGTTPVLSPGTTVPSAPVLSAAPGSTQVVLTWTAPSDGGSAITGYLVETSANGSSGWSTVTTTGSVLTYTHTGRTNGTVYFYRVSAINSVGTGPVSNVASATPVVSTVPGAPTSLAPSPGNTQVALNWLAPASNGGSAITDYTVQYRTTSGPGAWNTFSHSASTSTSATVTGLTNGTGYDFQVAAVNGVGTSAYSTAASATPVLVYTDDFNRANGAPGSNWSSPNSTYVISSNRLVHTAAGDGHIAWAGGAMPSADHYVQVKLYGSASLYVDVTARTTSGGANNCYMAYWDFGSSKWTISKVVATAFSVVAQSATDTAPSDGYTLRLEVQGSAQRLYANGVLKLSTADTSLTTGTGVGLSIQDPGSADDFEAGSLGGTAPTVPNAPSGLGATAGNTQAALTWTAPSNGGAAITDYTVQYRTTAGPGSWNTFSHTASTSTAATVTGLTNGTGYDFQVAAVNSVGTSTYSATASATPTAGTTAPAAPVLSTATPGSTTVALTWTTPSNGGSAITDYIIQKSNDGSTGWTTISDGTSTATSYTVTGLTNGTIQYFRVAAVNAIGTGANSNVLSATPVAAATVPGAPTGLVATASTAQATLTWAAPGSNGGAAITNYTVQYRTTAGPGAWTTFSHTASTTPSITVTGLTNGTGYDFQVAAVNSVGTGSYSATASATPTAGGAFAKYRSFNGGSDLVTWTLGNLLTASANPQTLVTVTRLNGASGDAVMMFSPGYSTVDWYYNNGSLIISYFDGASTSNGPTWNPAGQPWRFTAFRSVSGSASKWSVSTHNGSSWPTPTHTTGATLGARTFSTPGVITMGGTPAMNVDIVFIARFNTDLTDAQINNLTSGIAAIQATPGLTNLWMLGQSTPADLKGTSTLNSLNGTFLSSTDSPFPN